jgi:glycosyltransferase involved in cell wall biosynthesis
MQEKPRILYLYAEIMGYTLSTINHLKDLGYEIHIVYWDKRKISSFQFENIEGIKFYPRSQYNSNLLKKLALSLKPDIVVVSGWQDFGYIKILRILRKNGSKIITGFDAHWKGTFKQRILFYLNFLVQYFYEYAWVAGAFQYEYARKLGFNKEKIIFDLYSANLDLFNSYFEKNKINKQNKFPRKFIYVGRFEKEKSLDLLIKAWKKIKNKHDWELHLIGEGSIYDKLKDIDDIYLHSFLQPKNFEEIISQSGCFILPSSYEPWGVVIHEFSAAGFPIICSDNCGAGSSFLINGYNGFKFKTGNIDSLAECIVKVIMTKDNELYNMSVNSNLLAQKINPITSANNLVSILIK